jgi:ubiquinone/menaquinone biosynthesis C-methylase UbiE
VGFKLGGGVFLFVNFVLFCFLFGHYHSYNLPNQEMDIIDIGCGTGNYAEYFLQFEPRSLTLMDANEGMLAKAKAKLPSDHPKTRLSFKQVVLPEMSYGDNLYDAAMMNLVC